MNRIAVILLMCLMTFPSCRSISPAEDTAPAGAQGNLERFFRVREKDLSNALSVIRERDLIKILTHLHKMNEGGKKYYLLERESITEMIRAVTEDIYSDFILVNRHGVVIYTREDDDIFGKNVTTSLKDSPMNRCFQKKNGITIEDAVEYPVRSGRYCMHVSPEVIVKEEYHGIFMLQVGIDRISEILEKDTFITDRNGLFRIHADRSMMLTPFASIDRVLQGEKRAGGPSFVIEDSGQYEVTPFSYRNLNWLVIKKI
jgi:hypothetical protein